MPECPVFDIDCPYCTIDGKCSIEKPFDECETYWYYNNDEEE